jgi:hypothetical protein
MNLRPMSLAELLGLAPGTSCEFGVCVPLGNGLVGAVSGVGSDSGFTIDVLVLARLLQPIGAAIAGSTHGIKPFNLDLPNVPSGQACNTYKNPIWRGACNFFPNDPVDNCVRGCLLNGYDPDSGYRRGAKVTHCECFASCGMSAGNPAQIIWECFLP